MNVKQIQLKILDHLVCKGRSTLYGKSHGFSTIKNYPAFTRNIPIASYRDLEPLIERMKTGEKDILWPGRINRYAVSSGTTGKGKHLPVSAERLKSDRRFIRKLTCRYLMQRPNPFRLAGMHLSLPGSVENKGELQFGEISGYTAMESPWWIRPFQLVDPQQLVRLEFKDKFDHILERLIHAGPRIKVISAVPSWILTLFQRILDQTGKTVIAEVLPNLRLMVCGGVKLSHYRPHLEKLAGINDVDFIETYGSSEGYFAFTDDINRGDLGLVYDNGMFYEFTPCAETGKNLTDAHRTTPVPLWEVDTNVPYAMVVTSNTGLWRYALNDVVEFTSTHPPRILVKGRLSEMLDDFGEALHIWEAEKALEKVCRTSGIETGEFTVGACLDSASDQPGHHWFIQFFSEVSNDAFNKLPDLLDQSLRDINRHYAIRRESGALSLPRVYRITQSDINSWYEFKGRKKAQSKLPKLLSRIEDIEYFRNR